jgi:hypothetical protein
MDKESDQARIMEVRPSIFIPPVLVNAETLMMMERKKDVVIMFSEISNDWHRSLTRSIVRLVQGLPITFSNSFHLLQSGGGEKPELTKKCTVTRGDGTEANYDLSMYEKWIKVTNPYSFETKIHTHMQVNLSYWATDAIKNQADADNLQSKKECDKEVEDELLAINENLKARGYVTQAKIDFSSAFTAIGQAYGNE